MKTTSFFSILTTDKELAFCLTRGLFKKGTILIFLFVLTLCKLNAQHKLSGTILDVDKQALPGVNVLLLSSKDSTLIKGGVTNVNGKFTLEPLINGAYLLSISSVGFEKKMLTIELLSSKDIGIITLSLEERTLNEVTVQAIKPFLEQKLDRIIVNVQNSISAAGGSALDVLERSPGVIVNRGMNALSLNGKEGIVVMINGKVSRQSLSSVMQMLSGMNANSIEKIELITNPPAKYEAAGNGGIINIELSKSRDIGTNGSVSVNAGYGQREKAGANVNVNHRHQKANVYGDLSYFRDHRYAIWTNYRKVVGDLETLTTQSTTYREPIKTTFNGRIGLDYQLTGKTVIGGFISGFSNIWDMPALTQGSTLSSNNPASYVEVDLMERGRLNHLMANVNVSQKIGQTTQLNIDLDYLYYKDRNKTDYYNRFSNQTTTSTQEQVRVSSKLTPINIWVGSMDFTSNLSEKFQLQYGLKGIFSRLNNDVIVKDQIDGDFIVDEAFTEISQLDENIGALYVNTNYKINDKTDVNVGLRYEYSKTNLDMQDKGNVLDLTVSKLFPTFFLSRKLAKEASLQLSYGRRITRPSYGDLAPFFIFLDPTTFSYGNTSLKPAISDNVKLGIIYKQYILSLEHSHENNTIEGFQPVLLEGTNQQVYTTLNLDYKKTTSLVASFPVKITSWWNININLLGVRNELITPQNEKRTLSYYNINLTKNFMLPADYAIELSGFYQSPSLSGISRMGGYQSVNLGIAKKFKNESKLKFSFNNIFGFNFDFYTANETKSFTNLATFRLERRIFNLTYSYNFGNQKLKIKRSRSTGADEIKNRVN